MLYSVWLIIGIAAKDKFNEMQEKNSLKALTKSIFVGLMFLFQGCAQLSETPSVLESPPVKQEMAEASPARQNKRAADESFERNIYAQRPISIESEGIQEITTDSMSNEELMSLQRPISIESEGIQEITTDSMSNEELMSLAQKHYQEAVSFWENGKDKDAIRALDNSYLLLAQVKENATEELKQQKEALRLDVSKRVQEINAAKCRAVPGKSCPIPIVLNKEVQREIDRFLGPERDFFLQSYKRSGKFREDIINLLREEGMPEELSWLPFIESGFQPRAVSPARAVGLWQFIASTGHRFGLKRDSWVDERLDPVKSSTAAIGYLKSLHSLFGDWTTALAAYNCGEGLVSRVIEKQKINYLDNFWDLYRQLPEESARFVPRFLAVIHLVNNAEQYGLDLGDPHEAKQYETVSLSKYVHLDSVANKLGIYYSELSELNPELRRDIAPDGYNLKVPFGYADALAQSLEEIPEVSGRVASNERKTKKQVNATTVKTHVVKKGETLTSIAAKYGVAVKDLIKINGWNKAKALKSGSRVKIVRDTDKSTGNENLAPTVTARKASDNKQQAAKAIKKPPTDKNKADVADSLKVTAKKEKKQVKEEKKADESNEKSKPTSAKKRHIVQKNDTLYNLAKHYNTTVDNILKLNGLKKNTSIRVGQELVVVK